MAVFLNISDGNKGIFKVFIHLFNPFAFILLVIGNSENKDYIIVDQKNKNR